jgi:hypothetical protein
LNTKVCIGAPLLRYIEVVANARVEREVEGYEVMLELSTSGGRNVACFDQAIALREAIVGLLKNSGLTDADIHEGGGEASQSSWSSRKDIFHRIAIRNTSMDKLMSVMAATERHFAGLPRRLFGRTKQDFTFHSPVPIYASSGSADEALCKAMRRARRTAEVIAKESGFRLGRLISVVEQHSEPRQNSNVGFRPEFPADMGDNSDLAEGDSFGEISYTHLRNNRANAARCFNVRYAVEDEQQSLEGRAADNADSNG